MKHAFQVFALLLCLLLACLPGCAALEKNTLPKDHREELDASEPIVLKVLMERTSWGDDASTISFNKRSQVSDNILPVFRYYEAQHPNVDIQVETLTLTNEREYAIEQRRVALAAGDVPDLYLMPTLSPGELYGGRRFDLLFRDPAQTMTNGWFADISAYYDADEDLHTEELQPVVIEAGVYEGKRYILPLGYSFPVAVLRKDAPDADKVAEILRTQGYQALLTELPQLDECWMSFWAENSAQMLNFFPHVCDYKTEKLFLEQEDVSAFVESCHSYMRAVEDHARWDSNGLPLGFEIPGVDRYLAGLGGLGLTPESPGDIDSIEWVPERFLLSQLTETPMEVVPLRCADGSLTASVTYWGAVSGASEHKAWAYDFLRLLLSPEVQHSEPLVDDNGTVYRVKSDSPGDWRPGWPVRRQGHVEPWLERLKKAKQVGEYRVLEGEPNAKETRLAEAALTDSDLSFLNEEIARVWFPCVLDQMASEAFSDFIYRRNTDPAGIAKATETLLREMRYQLAEG